MVDEDQRSDAALLAITPGDPAAFSVFYRRHVAAVLTYLVGRTNRPDLAADICAEVFATALETSDRFDERRGPARAWLFTMASSRCRTPNFTRRASSWRGSQSTSERPSERACSKNATTPT